MLVCLLMLFIICLSVMSKRAREFHPCVTMFNTHRQREPTSYQARSHCSQRRHHPILPATDARG